MSAFSMYTSYLKKFDRVKGRIFTAHNAIPLTGLASKDAPTTYIATAACLSMFNTALHSDAGGTNVTVVPMFVTLKATAVNTSASNFQMVGHLDQGDRFTSGGSVLAPQATHMDTDTGSSTFANITPKCRVNAGLLLMTAVTAADEDVFRAHLSNNILAVDDKLVIEFGEGASSADQHAIVSPVTIGPGCTLVFHDVAAAQAADPAFEYSVTWAEFHHPVS